MATIEQINESFREYYTSLNKEYNNKFALFCEENGFDEDSIRDDIENETDESFLVDFDDDFPFKHSPKDEQSTKLFIHRLIWRFYHFSLPADDIIPKSYFTITLNILPNNYHIYYT